MKVFHLYNIVFGKSCIEFKGTFPLCLTLVIQCTEGGWGGVNSIFFYIIYKIIKENNLRDE